MKQLGKNKTVSQLQDILKQNDVNNDGVLNYDGSYLYCIFMKLEMAFNPKIIHEQGTGKPEGNKPYSEGITYTSNAEFSTCFFMDGPYYELFQFLGRREKVTHLLPLHSR